MRGVGRQAFDLSTGGTTYFLDLDGTPNDPVWTPNDHEPFCSGYVAVDNRLFIYGNDLWHVWTLSPVHIPVTTTWASFFDPGPTITDPRPTTMNWIDAGPVPQNSGSDNTVCDGVEWSLARYYPTCTLLPDGRVLMAAGDFWTDCNGDHDVQTWAAEYDQQERWLIYDPSTNTWEVDIDPGGFNNPWNQEMVSYPHMKVLPYGLFWHGNDGTTTGSDIASRLWAPFETWGDPSPPAPLQHVNNHNHTDFSNPAYCRALSPPGPPSAAVVGGRHAAVTGDRNPGAGPPVAAGVGGFQLVVRVTNERTSGAMFDLVVGAGGEGRYRMRVFDVAGRIVVDSDLGVRAVGRSTARWDGRAADGQAAAAGMYFVRVEGPCFHATRKAVIVR